MKLNLGAGFRKRPGFINVDKEPAANPDVLHDLNLVPWPFKSDSADEIVAHHVLEHLGRETDTFLAIIKEIYRILKPGATIDIRVPHFHCITFWDDPTHVRAITPGILALFSKRRCREFVEKGWPNTPLALYLDVDLDILSMTFQLTPRWAARLNSGEVTKEELDYFVDTNWNVVEETRIVLQKVPQTQASGVEYRVQG